VKNIRHGGILSLCFKFTAESASERDLKTGQHLIKL